MNEQHDSQTHRPRVIVVGNLTIDDVVLPDGTVHMESIGGNTLYSALGARLWQPDVGIVTRRGEDFPTILRRSSRRSGSRPRASSISLARRSATGFIYEHNGERHWLYRTPRERSREVAVQPGDLPREWLTGNPPRLSMLRPSLRCGGGASRRRAPRRPVSGDYARYARGLRGRLSPAAPWPGCPGRCLSAQSLRRCWSLRRRNSSESACRCSNNTCGRRRNQ
jgi:hypothetical protein